MSLDLVEIAQIERIGSTGKLFSHLDGLLTRSDIAVPGHPDAVIWQLGNHTGLQPVVHTITDKFSLVGVLGAIEILGLPGYGVPCMAQYRHDMDLAPFEWLTALGGVPIKWSTAGDTTVDDGKGGQVVVKGKSGNAELRTATGTYCNLRTLEFATGKVLTFIRAMPMLPYSQDKKAFRVDSDGQIHSEMNTDGIRIAFAIRKALELLHERTTSGNNTVLRAVIKPTQALEDGVMAGLLRAISAKTQVNRTRSYGSDYNMEHKESVTKIIACLPSNFFQGMEDWRGELQEIIADYSYPMLLDDMIEKNDVVFLTTDLDGDRGTDLLAGAPETILKLISKVLELLKTLNVHSNFSALEIFHRLGFQATHGMSIQSVMHTMEGTEIFEMLLGTADSMLHRLLDGTEDEVPYYTPRIHFELTIAAALRANPEDTELKDFCTEAMSKFDLVYGDEVERPSFLQGMAELQGLIIPWGSSK